MNWQDFKSGEKAHEYFSDFGQKIKAGSLDLGRSQYALSLALGLLGAIHCQYGKITAIEFGVATGSGLLDLCKAAKFFRDELQFDIDVYGFDNAVGLPAPKDYRDHPELWRTGQFRMRDESELRAALPDFAHLILGDIAETVGKAEEILERSQLGFVAVDLDFYSSTKGALKIFEHPPLNYLPAVPVYFDDIMYAQFTQNRWCGEPLAIEEFNNEHRFRKIDAKLNFRIPKLHACHILDHPVRTGQQALKAGFGLMSFRNFLS